MGPALGPLSLVVAKIILNQFREDFAPLIPVQTPHAAPLVSVHPGLSSARTLSNWFSRELLPDVSS